MISLLSSEICGEKISETPTKNPNLETENKKNRIVHIFGFLGFPSFGFKQRQRDPKHKSYNKKKPKNHNIQKSLKTLIPKFKIQKEKTRKRFHFTVFNFFSFFGITVMEVPSQNKHRKKGTGSFRYKQRALKTKGLSYQTYKNRQMPAKQLSSFQVSSVSNFENRKNGNQILTNFEGKALSSPLLALKIEKKEIRFLSYFEALKIEKMKISFLSYFE
ncbi:hypothetical protein C0J52_25053, partial [Blattella germanica]